MDRVSLVPDAQLAREAKNCYPAWVEVELSTGEKFEARVSPTPGSPDNPWSIADVAGKFAGIQRVGLDADAADRIQNEIAMLAAAEDLSGLLAALAPPDAEPA
jgi:2-methylcitrate dehydratase PrpD